MKVLALADSDSYIKWGAALLSQMPVDWDREFAIVATQAMPSDGQLDAALAGSGISRAETITLQLTEIVPHLRDSRPDVLLVAMRGPSASVVMRDVSMLTDRPVMVSGLPGISVPATWKALYYRSQSDMMVLHSKREIREFSALAHSHGWNHGLALATLPFARRGRSNSGADIIFAAQAIVPARRDERERVLDVLVKTAELNPDRRIVIKIRAAAGEQQTHAETFSYPDLLAARTNAPRNLVVASGPMSDALDNSAGLITLSSTAAIEAAARGLPVLALDEFGVSDKLINRVFEGSGLFGDEAAVLSLRLAFPKKSWLDDNYLHDAQENDWLDVLGGLLQIRSTAGLPRRTSAGSETGGFLRRAWDRKRAFGRSDRSFVGILALGVGVPTRAVVRLTRRVRGMDKHGGRSSAR